MGSKRMLDEALCQALKSEAAKAKARPPTRLHVVSTGASSEPWSLGTERSRIGDPHAGSVGALVIFGETANRDTPGRNFWKEYERDWRNEWRI
jgi:hypothetical protein